MTEFINPTTSQYGAYTAAYDYFIAELFGNSLPPCLLNFSRKAKANGFFSPDRWESVSYDTDVNTETTHEISLNPDHLDRPLIEMFGTLVHEMVHLRQQEEGKPSRGTYHNSEWASMMDSVGLSPTSTGQPGGKRVGQRVTHLIVLGGPFDRAFARMPESCKLPWLSSGQATKPKLKKESKIKYTCPGCQSAAWGKPGLHMLCQECLSPTGAYLPYQPAGEVANEPEVVAAVEPGENPIDPVVPTPNLTSEEHALLFEGLTFKVLDDRGAEELDRKIAAAQAKHENAMRANKDKTWTKVPGHQSLWSYTDQENTSAVIRTEKRRYGVYDNFKIVEGKPKGRYVTWRRTLAEAKARAEWAWFGDLGHDDEAYEDEEAA